MKMFELFKTLNYKINKYDKLFSNPFIKTKTSVTLVWVEDKNTTPTR